MVTALLAGAPASAQDRTSAIDAIFDWTTPETPGCAVGISLHGKVVVSRAYGLADLEEGVPITPSTVFDAGSLVKQFVAAAVLLLVEDGLISLADDVREYIPELPDYGDEITVDHLLTHTSGVRDWTGLLRLSGEDADALTLILRQRGLNFAPGEEWSYSNSGYVLLKELVARVGGTSFSEFARTRLFEPLGMEVTTYADDVTAVENHALAYEKEGASWRLDILVGNARGGGGALLTTVGDLLLWNEALTDAGLGAFVSEKIQEPARLNSGRKLGYARGLFLDTNRGTRVVWHDGSAGGYKSTLARFPEQGLSIAILSNAGDSAVRTLSVRRIFDLFVTDTGAAAAEAEAPAAAALAPDLRSKEGLFFNELTGEPLRLVVNDGTLCISGGPALITVAGDRFRNPKGLLAFMSGDEFELHFPSWDELELTSMEGETTWYRRAQPQEPTPAELEPFAGRYESDELRAVFEIEPGDDGLTIRLNGSQTVAFAPVDRDTFQQGRLMVRFHRSKDGDILALDYSNPMLRNIRFTRAGDATGGG